MHGALIQDSVRGGKQHKAKIVLRTTVLGCSYNSEKRLDPTPRRSDTSCCGEVVRPYGLGVIPATADSIDRRSICVASRCDASDWDELLYQCPITHLYCKGLVVVLAQVMGRAYLQRVGHVLAQPCLNLSMQVSNT